MSVTRYGINAQGVFTNLTDGGYVSYQDYEKLAAENAGLKQFPDQIVGFIGKLGSSEIGSETKEKIEAAAKKIKTPATDAFLAEVRAQGVEMFAKYIALYNSNSEHHAQSFAAQLRKGVQS